jgi:hypothetical protein
MALSDYWTALECGAKGRGMRAAWVPAEILLARFGYGLGPRMYSLYRLWRKPVSQWGEYLDDRRKNRLLRPLFSSEQVGYLDDKVEFCRRCTAAGLPTVPVLGVITGGDGGAVAGVERISSPAALAALVAGNPHGLFLKPRDAAHGVGGFSILPVGSALDCGGRRFSPEEAYEDCRSRAARHGGLLVVEPRVRPARELMPVMSPHGLGTIRAVTRIDGRQARVLAACLRIPVGTNDADNFKHGASGNLTAGIELASGRLLRTFGSTDRNWPRIVEVERHPDTGGVFAGFQLPRWGDLLEVVERAQLAFAGLTTVGWDVAITDDGPVLIEGNPASDADLLQVALDRGLRSVLLEGFDPAVRR